MMERRKVFWAIGNPATEEIREKRFYTRSQAEQELHDNHKEYPFGCEVVEVSMTWRTGV